MRLTYDATTDVAYLELRRPAPGEAMGPALFLERDHAFHGFVIADFTEGDGMLAGFEVLGASECLPADLLAAAERVDGRNAALRFEARIGGNPRFTGEGAQARGPRRAH